MRDELDGILEQLQAARDLADLQHAAEALRDHYAIAHIVYHWVSSAGDQYGAGTYSQAWVDRYLEKGYLRLDPVLHGCMRRFDPVDWKQLDWSGRAVQAFFREAQDYGVGNQGWTLPIRGPGGQFALFTASDRCDDATWAAFIARAQREMIILAHEFNKKALEFEGGAQGAPAPPLSPREQLAMTCIAKGLSRAQAAHEMGISEHTLRVYIEAARHKLGALNTTHAVARALSRDVIVL